MKLRDSSLTALVADELLHLVYQLTGPGHDHVGQLLVAVVPVVDAGERDHDQHRDQVLAVQHEVLLLHQVGHVPRHQAARLFLLYALQI